MGVDLFLASIRYMALATTTTTTTDSEPYYTTINTDLFLFRRGWKRRRKAAAAAGPLVQSSSGGRRGKRSDHQLFRPELRLVCMRIKATGQGKMTVETLLLLLLFSWMDFGFSFSLPLVLFFAHTTPETSFLHCWRIKVYCWGISWNEIQEKSLLLSLALAVYLFLFFQVGEWIRIPSLRFFF